MKKSLLLAVAALLGLAPNASALRQVNSTNISELIKDGAVIALQTPSTTGGQWRFFNGPQTVKTAKLNTTGLIKLVASETQEGRFLLQNYNNDQQYINNPGNGSDVAWTEDKAAAASFEIYVESDLSKYDNDNTQDYYIEMGECTVRFNKGADRGENKSYLNGRGENENTKVAPGIGGWSWWFAYVLDEEDIAQVAAGNSPSMVSCFFTYESPLGSASPLEGTPRFHGMEFRALSGVSLDDLPYLDTYQGKSDYFTDIVLDTELMTQNDQTKIISATNFEFPVTITLTETGNNSWESDWHAFYDKYTASFSKANRLDIRPTYNSENYVAYSYIDIPVAGDNPDGQAGEMRANSPIKVFGPGQMWYMDYQGLDHYGNPAVHVMSVQFPGYGLTIASANNNHCTLSKTPTLLSYFPATKTTNITQNIVAANKYEKQDNDFVLALVDLTTGNYSFINDFNGDGVFSTYNTSVANGRGDMGSIMRMIPLDAAEFDNYDAELAACGYDRMLEAFEKVDGYDNGVDVSDATIAKAKESRDPADVTKLFPEDMCLLNGLRAYYEVTGICQLDTDGEQSLPGWPLATDTKVKALYTAIEQFKADVLEDGTLTTENDQAVAQARWTLLTTTLPEVGYAPTPGAIYTLESTDSNRGWLVNNGGHATSTAMASTKTYEDTPEDFQFTFVQVGDKLYMYNLGAEQFMNAFGEKAEYPDSKPAKKNCSDYTWRFADVPTPVRGLMKFKDVHPHSFTILAGMTSGSTANFTGDHEGGLSIANDTDRNLLVSCGISDRGDGNGLYAHYVGSLTADELAAVAAKASAALAAHAIPDSFDDINGIINHFDADTHAALKAAVAQNGGDHSHAHYLFESGTAGMQNFDTDQVYNVFVNDTDAWMMDVETGTFKVATYDPDNADAFCFKPAAATPAAVAGMRKVQGESTGYTLVHSHTNDYGQKLDMPLTIGGSTDVTAGSLGKVMLGDQELVAKVGSGTAETTGISEINAAADASKVIYDLQGRRMAAPVKGLNIINGKKVIR